MEMAAGGSPDWQEARAVAAQARALRERVVPLAQADSEAYAEVLATLELQPRGFTSERDFALGVALDRAAELPLAIAEAAADVTELAAHAAFSCAVKVRGEVLTAAVLSEAAVRAAAGLVEINLATAEGDGRVERGRSAAAAAAAALRHVGGTV
jgi:formiminotetrahydrofolate cyclodeaminase